MGKNTRRGRRSACVVLALAGSSILLADDFVGPLDVDELWFPAGQTERIEWSQAAEADSYGLYRGEIGPEGFRLHGTNGRYDHVCLATKLPQTWALDPDRPRPGTAWYYIATGLRFSAGPYEAPEAGVLSPDGSLARHPFLRCGPRLYVREGGSSAPDGLSWESAFGTVQEAIDSVGNGAAAEIWLAGEAVGDANPSSWDGGLIYGGFDGQESYVWERSPSSKTSRIRGVFQPTEQDANRPWALEGLVVEGLSSYYCGGYLLADVRMVGDAVVLTPSDHCSWTIGRYRRVTFGGGLFWQIQGAAESTLEIMDSSMERDGGPVLHVRANGGMIGDVLQVQIVNNRIRGGTIGLWIDTSWVGDGGDSYVDGLVASNTIVGSETVAVLLETRAGTGAPAYSSRIDLVLAGNTIADSGGDGVSCHAEGGGISDMTGEIVHASCSARLVDNLVTHHDGAGAVESITGDQRYNTAELVLVGNDFWALGGPAYRTFDGNSLPDADAINSREGHRENFSADPLYRDLAGGDIHLLDGSPAIDRAVAGTDEICEITDPEIPWRCAGGSPSAVDLDGDPRGRDGDGDGAAGSDVGADEH